MNFKKLVCVIKKFLSGILIFSVVVLFCSCMLALLEYLIGELNILIGSIILVILIIAYISFDECR